jgi:hypothetical protein
VLEATHRLGLEILDRVGGGDSFASGLVHGLLRGLPVERALEYGAAHGALAMTSPRGYVSMGATLNEVERLVQAGSEHPAVNRTSHPVRGWSPRSGLAHRDPRATLWSGDWGKVGGGVGGPERARPSS